jgi:hypothetical protein
VAKREEEIHRWLLVEEICRRLLAQCGGRTASVWMRSGGRRRRRELAMEAATQAEAGGQGKWLVGRDGVVRGFREWDAGLSFLARFGRADLRSLNRASHLGRAESLFSIEVGSAQVPEPV